MTKGFHGRAAMLYADPCWPLSAHACTPRMHAAPRRMGRYELGTLMHVRVKVNEPQAT